MACQPQSCAKGGMEGEQEPPLQPRTQVTCWRDTPFPSTLCAPRPRAPAACHSPTLSTRTALARPPGLGYRLALLRAPLRMRLRQTPRRSWLPPPPMVARPSLYARAPAPALAPRSLSPPERRRNVHVPGALLRPGQVDIAKPAWRWRLRRGIAARRALHRRGHAGRLSGDVRCTKPVSCLLVQWS